MDSDGRMDMPSGVQVDMAAASAWIALGSFLPAPVVATASAFIISAGSETFTLPVTVTASGYGTGTTEYAGNVRIQLVSNGLYLVPASHAEMHALRNGVVATSPSMPQVFCLDPDGSQVARGRCWPPPKVAEACNLWAAIKAEDLRDYVGTGGAEAMDTVTILGTREQVQALECRTARTLLTRIPAAVAEARGMDKRALLAEWAKEEKDLVYGAEQNHHGLKSVSRVQRWSS